MHKEARNLTTSLKSEHEAAGEVVLRVLEFLRRHRLIDDSANFVQQAIDSEMHVFWRRSDEGDESSRIETRRHRNARECGVCQTELVAQLLGNACSETRSPTK